MTIDYYQGYKQALIDLVEWMHSPGHSLDKRLIHPKRFRNVLHYITDNLDAFMECPDLFLFDFEITKKGVEIYAPLNGLEDTARKERYRNQDAPPQRRATTGAGSSRSDLQRAGGGSRRRMG